MTRTVLALSILLMIFLPKEINIHGAYGNTFLRIPDIKSNTASANELTPMQALDLVKNRYAANFEKMYPAVEDEYQVVGSQVGEYYYKLPEADYYLFYEGQGETEQDYLYHLYEFVLDEPDTGIGHTVTYGWFTVDKRSGQITDHTEY